MEHNRENEDEIDEDGGNRDLPVRTGRRVALPLDGFPGLGIIFVIVAIITFLFGGVL